MLFQLSPHSPPKDASVSALEIDPPESGKSSMKPNSSIKSPVTQVLFLKRKFVPRSLDKQ